MPTISSSQLPLPLNWQDFETITLDALKIRYNDPNFTKHGRPGQAQNGVDIYSTTSNVIIAAQCKLTFGTLTTKAIQDEVYNASTFNPPLNHLHICTTSPRDVHMQAFVRTISANFSVDILFWDDITAEIEKDQVTFQKHFQFAMPQTQAQIMRGRDIETLIRVFSTLHLPTIEYSLQQQIPRTISHLLEDYWTGFNELYGSYTINFYDPLLKNHIDRFHSLLSQIFDYVPHYNVTKNGFSFPIPGDVFETEEKSQTFEQIQNLRNQLCVAYKEMLAYIHQNYVEVDLNALSIVALTNHSEFTKKFNDIFK
jgi:hypothetical protein